jgi:hypothetical protein
MEKLLWEVPGVEYLYSQSREGEALTIVRFQVGSDPDASLVKVSEKLRANRDRMPHGVAFPLIKPRSIDDVPILALTFHSGRYDHLTLRRLVAQVDDAVKQVPQVAETTVIGDRGRLIVKLSELWLEKDGERTRLDEAPVTGSPFAAIRRMLRGETDVPHCSLEMARPQTVVINGAHRSSPVRPLPPEAVTVCE